MKAQEHRPIAALLGAMLIALTVLSGCREEKDQTLPSTAEQAAGQTPDEPVPLYWLEPDSDETPDDFIARLSETPRADIAPRLDRAEAIYQDSRRMIANRVVQLWQEIAEKDAAAMDLPALLDQLTAPDSVQVSSIGAVVQHYRMLRSQGMDHDRAIATALAGGGQP